MLYIVAMTTILGRGFHDWYGSADLDLKRNESVGVVMFVCECVCGGGRQGRDFTSGCVGTSLLMMMSLFR